MSSTNTPSSSPATPKEPAGKKLKRTRGQIIRDYFAHKKAGPASPPPADTQVAKAPSLPAEPTFTGIPVELRLKIYRLVLVVKGVINPYPSYFQSAQQVEEGQALPQVALLRTCRQLREEASPILYGQNTFRLNVTTDDLIASVSLGRLGGLQQEWLGTFWTTQASNIQHMVTAFSMADLHPQHKTEISERFFNHYRTGEPMWSYPTDSVRAKQQMISVIQTQQEGFQQEAWYEKTGLFWDFTNLRSLTLEFRDCYHPSGFPRDEVLLKVIEHLAEVLGERNQKGKKRFAPLKVMALGLKSVKEEFSREQRKEYGSKSWPEGWTVVDDMTEREDIVAAYDYFVTDDRLRTYAQAYPTSTS